MRDIADGFRVGDRFLRWGTLLGEAARALGGDGTGPIRREAVVPCELAYGLPALAARLGAPAADRPVLSVGYELAELGGLGADDWLGAVADLIGPAEAAERYEAVRGGAPGDTVVLHARWALGDCSIGLAVFGGPRRTEHGLSVGTLTLTWREEVAAEPFLAEWLARSARLTETAVSPGEIRVFALAWPGHPVHGARAVGPESEEARQLRHRRLCLQAPELLATPAAIAGRLSPRRFAVWADDRARIWGVSTLWETFSAAFGTAVRVEHIELLPAKGGGYSALEIGRWRVMSSAGSPDVAAAAGWLDGLPGVHVVRHDGYDC